MRTFRSSRWILRLSVPFAFVMVACAIGKLAQSADRAPASPSLTTASLPGLDGRATPLAAPEKGVTALVFYSSECPISNSYTPTLNALLQEFTPEKLRLVGVCVDPDLSNAELQKHAQEFALKYPVARDKDVAFGTKLGAKVTPEAFVFDADGRLRYHGRIDDQYAARRKRNANSETHELRDAIAAVLAGKPVASEYVEAVGCPLPDPPKSRDASVPTYSRDIAPIVQKNCQECHRPGQVGPFSLLTYDQVRKRAGDIATVVGERKMPPWKPAPGFGPKFLHDRSLSKEDVQKVTAWAAAGAPLGDASALPAPAQFSEDWALGTPDLVIEPAEDFQIPAEGDDIYRCFVIPTNLPEDRYIAAIEYRPGNRRVVHHVLSYADTSGGGRKRDKEDPGPGYSCFSGPGVEIHGDLGGWAPGNEPNFLPDGIGRALPSKADVIMQVHYHPSGKPETDRTRMGIYFSKKPVRQILHWAAALNPGMELPPGQKDIEIQAEWPAPVDLVAYAVTPHMHKLGREMTMAIKYPDGKVADLVKIDDWDFNWQNTYYFTEPIEVPKGSILRVVGNYDNTTANPHNPNSPPKLVKWGEATTDEMCIGFLAVTRKGQDLTKPGEKDDLNEIFDQQRKEYERQAREAQKRAREKDKKAREGQ